MKKFLIGLVVLGVLAVVVGLAAFSWGTGQYNNLVVLQERVKSSWSQVENVYQRRMDLIPNLVNTAKGYATHERETFKQVIEARAKASQVNVDVSKLLKGNGGVLTPAMVQQFQSAQGDLSSALGRLMVVMEKYPDLKANTLFERLMDEIAGTENRISVERRNFNEVAQTYNQVRRQFPTILIAGYLGFQEYPYFEADKNAKTAPKVEF